MGKLKELMIEYVENAQDLALTEHEFQTELDRLFMINKQDRVTKQTIEVSMVYRKLNGELLTDKPAASVTNVPAGDAAKMIKDCWGPVKPLHSNSYTPGVQYISTEPLAKTKTEFAFYQIELKGYTIEEEMRIFLELTTKTHYNRYQ